MNATEIAARRSRHLRKRRNRVTRLLGGEGAPFKRFGPVYWSVRNISWWIGSLFMIGSACFAAGTLIAVSANPKPAGIVFFIGSIFFTTAAYGQFLEVINAGQGNPKSSGRIRLFAIERRDIEWQAAVVQLAGTLFFNVSTFAALPAFSEYENSDRLAWRPDVYGSICFLIASWLAYSEVRTNWDGHPERGSEWWVTVLNLAGSVAFGISAIGAFVVPGSGTLLSAAAANGGTLIGAICFFAGAYLLWPEAAEAAQSEAAQSEAAQIEAAQIE